MAGFRCLECGDPLTDYEIDRGCEVCDFCAKSGGDDWGDDEYDDDIGYDDDDERDPQQEGWRP